MSYSAGKIGLFSSDLRVARVFKAACTPQRAVAVAVRFRSLPGRYGLDQDLLARRSLVLYSCSLSLSVSTWLPSLDTPSPFDLSADHGCANKHTIRNMCHETNRRTASDITIASDAILTVGSRTDSTNRTRCVANTAHLDASSRVP